MHPTRIPSILALCVTLALGWSMPVCANTLSPGHPVWESSVLHRGELVRALLELRERQGKQARALRPRSLESEKQLRSPARRFLILPVLYADGPAVPPMSYEEVGLRFFDRDRDDSFASWWERASAGAFIPQGRVLPWMRLSGPKSQYYNVVNGQPRFAATRRMAEEAVCLAAPALGDWWDYDNDGPDGDPGSGDDDGILDFVIVLHPDPGIEILVQSDGIVALQDRMDLDTVLAECGVGADPFVVASVLDPLGVWVHESGHLLGLVDLYDLEVPPDQTDTGRAVGGLGLWSLMATGTWGDDGRSPTDLDAYSRSLLGWNLLTETASHASVELETGAGRELVSLRPALDWGRERYFMEARSPRAPDGIDRALPGEGVLIYRVDESAEDCQRTSALRLVELIQADGRHDLENLRNEGDPGDPYTGAAGSDVLGPLSDPDSFSREPANAKLPPEIRVSMLGSLSWRVDLDASAVPAFQLREARFEDGSISLPVGATRSWHPVFDSLGPAVGTARLRVATTENGLSASPLGWIDLQRRPDGAYVLADTLRLSADPSSSTLDLALGLELQMDVRVQPLSLGIPIGTGGGISSDEFAGWERVIDSPGTPATQFVPLGPAERPPGSGEGWRLDTSTDAAYGNCAALTLVSPWISPSQSFEDTLGFWSRVHTEVADPHEAWDGGVIEIQWPGQAWIPLYPEGRGVVQIRPLSPATIGTASTGGAMGLGGGPLPWSEYRAHYPVTAMPYRLRFHFGSDATVFLQDPEGGWSLAGAEVVTENAASELRLRTVGSGRMEALFTTQSSSVDSVSLHWRRAPSLVWLPLAEARDLDAEGFAAFEFELPAAPYFEVGAFQGSTATVLLARDGWRRAGARELIAFPNPSAVPVNFQSAISSTERELQIFERNGRLVTSLRFPAQLTVVSWDARDDAGRRVASGVYLARLVGPEIMSVSFTIIR